MQVQHIHICTLIGPAWIRFEPKLQLHGSQVPSPRESLSLLYHTNAYTFPPIYRHAACPAERETGLPGLSHCTASVSVGLSNTDCMETQRSETQPTLALLTARQRTLLARMFGGEKKREIILFQLTVVFYFASP